MCWTFPVCWCQVFAVMWLKGGKEYVRNVTLQCDAASVASTHSYRSSADSASPWWINNLSCNEMQFYMPECTCLLSVNVYHNISNRIVNIMRGKFHRCCCWGYHLSPRAFYPQEPLQGTHNVPQFPCFFKIQCCFKEMFVSSCGKFRATNCCQMYESGWQGGN